MSTAADDDAPTYDVFHRTWWRRATSPGWLRDLEPGCGPKQPIAEGVSWAEAQLLIAEWNENNPEGEFSDRAEFERS